MGQGPFNPVLAVRKPAGGRGPVTLTEEDLVWMQPRQRDFEEEEFVVPVETVQHFMPEILINDLSPLPEDRVPPPAEEATRAVPEHVALPEVDVAAPAVLTLAAPTVPDLTALVPQNRPAPVTIVSVMPVMASPTEPAASSNVPDTDSAAPMASATPATPALPATQEQASSSIEYEQGRHCCARSRNGE